MRRIQHLLAPAHHGGVVTDQLDAAQRGGDAVLVPQIAVHELDPGGELRGDLWSVGVRQQHVEHAHLMAGFDQGGHHAPTDETGTPRDEDVHRPRPGRRTP